MKSGIYSAENQTHSAFHCNVLEATCSRLYLVYNDYTYTAYYIIDVNLSRCHIACQALLLLDASRDVCSSVSNELVGSVYITRPL